MRDFRLLWTGQVLSDTASSAAALALPLLVLATTGSPTRAGLVGTVVLAATMLGMLPCGALADRLPKRYALVGADFVRACGSGTLAVLVLSGRTHVALLAALACGNALATAVFRSCEAPALKAVVPGDRLATALARNQVRFATAGAVGPVAGGALFAVHPALPFAVDAVSYLLSAATVVAIRTPLPPGAARKRTGPGAGRRGVFREPFEGVVFVWHDRPLRTALGLAAGVNLAFGAVYMVVVVGVAERGVPAPQVGLVVALAAVGGLLGATAAPKAYDRCTARGAFLAVLVLGALLVPLMAVAPNAAVVGLLFAACMTLPPVISVLVGAARIRRTPDELQGRVTAASSLLATSAAPVAPLTAGLLVEHAGAGRGFVVLGGLLAVLAVVCALARGLREGELTGQPVSAHGTGGDVRATGERQTRT
ncbi:MFS transporter [Streptomycetaceae bacterium NBC_01309]